MNKIYTFTQRNTKTKQKENKGTLKFNSVGENKAELYFYGDIVSDSWQSYWYEEDKCPQDIVDFQPQKTQDMVYSDSSNRNCIRINVAYKYSNTRDMREA